jgi:hypothetical protein
VPSANVTLRTLSLGSQDLVSGWYAKSFAASTVKMIIRPKGASFTYQGAGYYAKYLNTGFCGPTTTILEGDEVVDSNGSYYEVKTVEEEWYLNVLSHKVCELSKLPLHADRPASSGTWASVDDPRYRQRIYLNTYIPPLAAANLTKDDGVTAASYITCFAEPDYQLNRVFLPVALGGKNVDVLFAVHPPNTTPIGGYTLAAYAYQEKVPVEVVAIDKTGVTGDNMYWKGMHILRTIQETYPTGSIRQFENVKPSTVQLGSTTLYSGTATLTYTRGTT